MTRLHDDEPDTSPRVVRALLQDQVPEVAGLSLERLGNTGSDNALYRLGSLEGAADEVEPALVHGDLIPGNLLLADGRLAAVIDWGVLGAGDPAEDLNPAWPVLDAAGAAAFRETLDVDERSWLRGRGLALEQAIGGVVYSVPRRHPLGDVMQRTLERLLSR